MCTPTLKALLRHQPDCSINAHPVKAISKIQVIITYISCNINHLTSLFTSGHTFWIRLQITCSSPISLKCSKPNTVKICRLWGCSHILRAHPHFRDGKYQHCDRLVWCPTLALVFHGVRTVVLGAEGECWSRALHAHAPAFCLIQPIKAVSGAR